MKIRNWKEDNIFNVSEKDLLNVDMSSYYSHIEILKGLKALDGSFQGKTIYYIKEINT